MPGNRAGWSEYRGRLCIDKSRDRTFFVSNQNFNVESPVTLTLRRSRPNLEEVRVNMLNHATTGAVSQLNLFSLSNRK